MEKIRSSLYLVIYLISVTIGPGAVFGQSYNYEVTWVNPETHYLSIKLATAAGPGESTTFQIPEWRPGRYELMNYAAGIAEFSASDQQGNLLDWKKTTVNDWQVMNPSSGDIVISYQFYATVMDAGSSVLNDEQAYINGINLFMHVKERYNVACVLKFPDVPPEWKIATALNMVETNTYTATDYHDLVDSPLILSPTLKTLHFSENEVDYYIHYQGEFGAGEEGEKLLVQNTMEIVKEQSALFNGVPFQAYHFLFQFVPEMTGHAVEHANSSMYVLGAAFVRDAARFNLLYMVVSHEFFHLWNVKRIRPAALWPYDYQTRPYTGLHWFTEGVTSYYADLILVRAGIMSHEDYYRSLARVISQMQNSYAEKEISPYLASMDSWLEGSAYSHPDMGISYYSLGHRLGIYLDITLRTITKGEKGLDDVFIYLFENYYKQGMGVPENGIQLACEVVSNSSFEDFFNAHIDGTEEMDYNSLFEGVGLTIAKILDTSAGVKNFGLITAKNSGDTLTIERVLGASDALQAGLKAGMQIISINGKSLADQSVGSFLKNAQYPMDLKFQIAGQEEEIQMKWSGKQNRYRFSIEENTGANKLQISIRNKWLKSRQE